MRHRGFRFRQKSAQNPWDLAARNRSEKTAWIRHCKSKTQCYSCCRYGRANQSGRTEKPPEKDPEWELEKKHIERTFEFDEFSEAIDFVNSVAEVAEDEEHHPDIDIRYNKVRLILSTHSKGGLTDLDFALAERIDTLSE
jgi:Pterin-4a-carbinolamine dehydratase